MVSKKKLHISRKKSMSCHLRKPLVESTLCLKFTPFGIKSDISMCLSEKKWMKTMILVQTFYYPPTESNSSSRLIFILISFIWSHLSCLNIQSIHSLENSTSVSSITLFTPKHTFNSHFLRTMMNESNSVKHEKRPKQSRNFIYDFDLP